MMVNVLLNRLGIDYINYISIYEYLIKSMYIKVEQNLIKTNIQLHLLFL